MNYVAVINIAKSQLGLEEDSYRALLVRVTGVPSLRAMNGKQLIAVFEEMKRLGFRVKSGGKTLPPASKPYIRMIHAMWKACHRTGVVEDGSRQALRAFCRGILFPGDDTIAVDPDTLDFEKASKVIDVLKAMERRGKVNVQ